MHETKHKKRSHLFHNVVRSGDEEGGQLATGEDCDRAAATLARLQEQLRRLLRPGGRAREDEGVHHGAEPKGELDNPKWTGTSKCMVAGIKKKNFIQICPKN